MWKKKFKRIFNWPLRYRTPETVVGKWGMIDHQFVQSLISLQMTLQALEALRENTANNEEVQLVEDCIEFVAPALAVMTEGYRGYVKLRDVYKV